MYTAPIICVLNLETDINIVLTWLNQISRGTKDVDGC